MLPSLIAFIQTALLLLIWRDIRKTARLLEMNRREEPKRSDVQLPAVAPVSPKPASPPKRPTVIRFTIPVVEAEPAKAAVHVEKTPPDTSVADVPMRLSVRAPEWRETAPLIPLAGITRPLQAVLLEAPHVDPTPTRAISRLDVAEQEIASPRVSYGFDDVPTDPNIRVPDLGLEDISTDPDMPALDDGFDVDIDTDPGMPAIVLMAPKKETKKEPERKVALPSEGTPTVLSDTDPIKRKKERRPLDWRPVMVAPEKRAILCGSEWYDDRQLSELLVRRVYESFLARAPSVLRNLRIGSEEELLARVPPIPDLPASWMLRYQYLTLVLPDVPFADVLTAVNALNLSMHKNALEDGYVATGGQPYWIRHDDGGNYLGVDPAVAVESLLPTEASLFPREALFIDMEHPGLLPEGVSRAWDLTGGLKPAVLYRSASDGLCLEDRDAVARPNFGTVVRVNLPVRHKRAA